MLENYRSPDPGVYTLSEDSFDAGFLAAWRSDDPLAWSRIADEIHPRVHQLRILRQEWCGRLDAEVRNIEAHCEARGIELQRPNSMNEYGVVLDHIGFESALGELLGRYLQPLAARLYADLGGGTFDEHHGFIVDYARGKDEDLGYHVDDSEMTLNLCLGERFDGSELYFRGRRCELHRQTPSLESEKFELHHEPGTAILHAGKHRHGVHPLRHGVRRNLILWCRSSSYRRDVAGSTCPDWCGGRDMV